jgi:pSer/pThr/pTyr-binding forkhead associated (FHA) protein
MWILESTDPEFSMLFRVMPGPPKTMGRAPRADFIVDAPMVSRLHCRLSLDATARLDVEDLGSTNGTWVNEKKIKRTALMAGDVVKVGRVVFAVRPATGGDA